MLTIWKGVKANLEGDLPLLEFWLNPSSSFVNKRLHLYKLIILVNPSRPDAGQREKINLNFYFHAFLWSLIRFYEGLHKTF